VYSSQRTSLIRFVPDGVASAAQLRQRLIKALGAAPASDRAARELLTNLTDPARTADKHRADAAAYLAACAKAATEAASVEGWLRVAAQRREAIENAETARNPQGVITERGFRVIFPVQLSPTPKPLRLNATTGRAEPVPSL
jgi:hypothetical protein